MGNLKLLLSTISSVAEKTPVEPVKFVISSMRTLWTFSAPKTSFRIMLTLVASMVTVSGKRSRGYIALNVKKTFWDWPASFLSFMSGLEELSKITPSFLLCK